MVKRKISSLKVSSQQQRENVFEKLSPIAKRPKLDYDSPSTPSSTTSNEETEHLFNLASEFAKRTPVKPLAAEQRQVKAIEEKKLKLENTRVMNEKRVQNLVNSNSLIQRSVKPLTEPIGFNLRSESRVRQKPVETSPEIPVQQQRQIKKYRVKRTVPQEFNFQKVTRARSVPLKSSEEMELEKIRNAKPFKAREFDKNKMGSGLSGVPKVQKKQLTTFSEFHLGPTRKNITKRVIYEDTIPSTPYTKQSPPSVQRELFPEISTVSPSEKPVLPKPSSAEKKKTLRKTISSIQMKQPAHVPKPERPTAPKDHGFPQIPKRISDPLVSKPTKTLKSAMPVRKSPVVQPKRSSLETTRSRFSVSPQVDKENARVTLPAKEIQKPQLRRRLTVPRSPNLATSKRMSSRLSTAVGN